MDGYDDVDVKTVETAAELAGSWSAGVVVPWTQASINFEPKHHHRRQCQNHVNGLSRQPDRSLKYSSWPFPPRNSSSLLDRIHPPKEKE